MRRQGVTAIGAASWTWPPPARARRPREGTDHGHLAEKCV